MIDFRNTASTLIERRLRRRLRPFSTKEWEASALIVAPHPDDETLGCGGIACKKIASGAAIRFVFVTDGAASHAGLVQPKSLGQMRETEAREAVARLGGSAQQIDFLRYPDGEASFHVTAIASDVAGLLERHLPDSVFIPHASDFTADHAAVNAAARQALALHGRRISVYEYPIWFWYHWPWVRLTGHMSGLRRPVVLQSMKTACGLVASSALNRSAYVGDVLHRKRAALAAHVSQTQCGGDDNSWSTLHDLSQGDFVRRLLADYETFRQYEVNTSS